MVNKPLIRPYFLGGVALGGVARIPMIFMMFFYSVSTLPETNGLPLKINGWKIKSPLGISYSQGLCQFHGV